MNSKLRQIIIILFSCDRQIKEIGIRKANGASIREIIIMLNKDFIKWVIITVFLALPIAWYAMYRWPAHFACKTGLKWWIFISAGLIALVILFITTSWKSWRAARRNPPEVIREE